MSSLRAVAVAVAVAEHRQARAALHAARQAAAQIAAEQRRQDRAATIQQCRQDRAAARARAASLNSLGRQMLDHFKEDVFQHNIMQRRNMRVNLTRPIVTVSTRLLGLQKSQSCH